MGSRFLVGELTRSSDTPRAHAGNPARGRLTRRKQTPAGPCVTRRDTRLTRRRPRSRSCDGRLAPAEANGRRRRPAHGQSSAAGRRFTRTIPPGRQPRRPRSPRSPDRFARRLVFGRPRPEGRCERIARASGRTLSSSCSAYTLRPPAPVLACRVPPHRLRRASLPRALTGGRRSPAGHPRSHREPLTWSSVTPLVVVRHHAENAGHRSQSWRVAPAVPSGTGRNCVRHRSRFLPLPVRVVSESARSSSPHRSTLRRGPVDHSPGTAASPSYHRLCDRRLPVSLASIPTERRGRLRVQLDPDACTKEPVCARDSARRPSRLALTAYVNRTASVLAAGCDREWSFVARYEVLAAGSW
jgi:hypothetical protein